MTWKDFVRPGLTDGAPSFTDNSSPYPIPTAELSALPIIEACPGEVVMAADADGGFESDWEAATEWGLASLVVGAVSAVAALLCLLIVVAAADYVRRWDRAGWAVGAIGGALGWIALASLPAAGFRWGTRSMAAARRRGLPVARGKAGAHLSGFGLLAALGAGLAWALTLIDQLP